MQYYGGGVESGNERVRGDDKHHKFVCFRYCIQFIFIQITCFCKVYAKYASKN